MRKLSGFRQTTSRMVGHAICVTHKIFTAPQSYIMSDTFSGCEQAIGTTAWNNIHGLSYHTYQTSLSGIQNDLNSLYSTYGKPIWVTEIADGSGSSMAANQQLMVQFVAWAASRTWIERVFWNQAVRSSTSHSSPMLPAFTVADCLHTVPADQQASCRRTHCEGHVKFCDLDAGSRLIQGACHVVSCRIMSWNEQILLLPQTPTSNGDPNVLNSYLVNHPSSGGGNNQLTSLGATWAAVPC